MLVLSRRQNESIVIAGRIKVTISKIRGRQVHLCIEAPSDVSVLRSELIDSPRRSIVLGPFVVHHAGASSTMDER